MNKNDLLTYLAAVLTTALETEPAPFPESMAYLALGSDMGKWEIVRAALTENGLITITRGHAIELTDAGRALARECNAALAQAKA